MCITTSFLQYSVFHFYLPPDRLVFHLAMDSDDEYDDEVDNVFEGEISDDYYFDSEEEESSRVKR